MAVSILIIAHDEIGQALLSAANKTLGELPLQSTAITVSFDADPERLVPKLKDLAKTLDEGDGVLILTDLYGSTPSNIAANLHLHDQIRVVSGLNLPMLIRVMNYPQSDLCTLAQKAFSGGKDGVINCESQI